MNSDVEVCNSALSLLGSRSIVSFVDSTIESRLCEINYPISRRFILRKHPWNFAIKRVLLAETTNVPINWEYSYQKPADLIRLLDVNSENTITSDEYQFEGNEILSNLTEIWIRYVSDFENVSNFDTEFENVLTHHLAMEMCEALHGSTTKKLELEKRFTELLDYAKATDARENPSIQIQESSWLQARRY